jgi:MFS transporter, CP family, cyanate transporter
MADNPTHDDATAIAPAPALIALFLFALSLRPQLVGIAPLIPDVQRDLGMTHAAAGLLGTIPVLCMGLFAPIAPFLAARFGTARAIGAAIAMIGCFGLLRAIAADAAGIVALTLGVGVGMGIAGALLPVLVKERLADRPVFGTVSYSAGLQLGSAVSAAIAVPLAGVLAGWRGSLAVFSGLTLTLLIPWIAILARGAVASRRIRIERGHFADRRAWLLAGVFALFGIVYYGLISWLPDAYVEIGWSAASAGGLVGLLNAAALVGTLSIGTIAGRAVPYGLSVIGLGVAFAGATIGLALVPTGAPIFALVAGYANGALFPLILAMPLRLVGSPARVAALSSVMLGAGYTLAGASPVGLGAIRDATGGFQASLVVLSVFAIAFAGALVMAARVPNEH